VKTNGYKATRIIREHDWGAVMIIIALTGWGQDNDRKLSREAGCDGRLVKPVILLDLNDRARFGSCGLKPLADVAFAVWRVGSCSPASSHGPPA
jgi:CheY-like chemotaxis protein